MSVIDMKGKPMQPTSPRETEEKDIAFLLSQAEQGLNALRIIAGTRPGLLRVTRIEHQGSNYGVAAFLRLIGRHIDFVAVAVRERRP